MKAHILVVEDEAFISMMLEDILCEMGCEAFVASSVESAIEAIAHHSFDGAILDFNLGRELSTPIMERLNVINLPFVIATGHRRDTLPPEANRAVAYFDKPYDMSVACGVLLRAVSQLLPLSAE